MITVKPLSSGAEPAPVAGRIEPSRRDAIGIRSAIDAWEAELGRRGGRDPRRLGRVRRVIDDIHAAVPDDLTKPAILEHLAARRTGADAIKAKTHDLILLDLRAFLGLCVDRGWLTVNAAEAIPLLGRGVAEDPNDTGAFLYDEYLRLIAAAQADEQGPRRFGFVRSPLYAVMWHAGLRVGEALQLRWHDLAFGTEANIRCRKAASKNAKLIWLPLHPDAAAILSGFRAPTAAPTDRLWKVEMHERVLQADMETAGVPLLGADGLTRSFAAFRKGLATWMALRGVQPALTQRMMRHSDIRLTMQFYTRLQVSDLRAVVTSDEKTVRNPLDSGWVSDDTGGAVRDSGDPMIDTLHNTALDSAAAGRTMGVASVSEQHPAAVDSATVRRTHPHAVSGVGRNAEGGTRTPPRLNSGGVAPTVPGHLAHLDALAAAHLRLVDAHAELVRLAGRGAGAC